MHYFKCLLLWYDLPMSKGMEQGHDQNSAMCFDSATSILILVPL